VAFGKWLTGNVVIPSSVIKNRGLLLKKKKKLASLYITTFKKKYRDNAFVVFVFYSTTPVIEYQIIG